MLFSNPPSDKNFFQGSRTCLALNPHPNPSPCGKSMLIPPNYSYQTAIVCRSLKGRTEIHKKRINVFTRDALCAMYKTGMEGFEMQSPKMLGPYYGPTKHTALSPNKYIRNARQCGFLSAGICSSACRIIPTLSAPTQSSCSRASQTPLLYRTMWALGPWDSRHLSYFSQWCYVANSPGLGLPHVICDGWWSRSPTQVLHPDLIHH